MSATTRNSTLYNNLYGTAPLAVPQSVDKGARMIAKHFKHTVVSGEVNGDIVNLQTLKAGEIIVGLSYSVNGVGASAGANVTTTIKSGSTTISTALDSDATDALGAAVFATYNHGAQTADEIVTLTWGGANPVTGKIVEGYLFIIRAGD